VRILYLHQFFTTREGSGGTRSYEHARHLVRCGHEVVMVTGARPGAGRSARYEVDGIDVREVRGASADYAAATARGYGPRIAGFAGFAAGATAVALRAPAPDVALATSPPLTIALPAIAVARARRVPLVFEVRDLWPEAPIQMGALRSAPARAGARALERAAYAAAAQVVALSPGMRDGVVAAGVAPERVTVIPNASDLDLFSPELDPGDLRATVGIAEGALLCAYFGTMGEANDLTQVIEAATLLRDRGRHEGEIAFVLQGEGKRRPALEAEVARRGLANVVVRPSGGKRSAALLAAASDACLTIFKDVPILATNSPNKLFDTFAAGRAAIVNTDGWQRELVERHGAGLAARPGDPAHLADQIERLADDRELAARLGAGARRLAEEQFDRRVLAERVRHLLEEVGRSPTVQARQDAEQSHQRAGQDAPPRISPGRDAEPSTLPLSYCVVNTNGRDYLLACLDAIERTHPAGIEHELLVLDNASDDGSVEAVRASRHAARVFALERRTGKAENDSTLLRAARGHFCLLLNEDSELCDGATAALLEALESNPGAAAAGAQLLSSEGEPKACAWRLPGILPALAALLFLQRRVGVQSHGSRTRRVGWAQSSAMLVRREAAATVGELDPDFFVYSDETDFAKRLRDSGWEILYVPTARAIHHDQLTTDGPAARRRLVEFHRGRARYLAKHRSRPAALAVRALGAAFYLQRALAAIAVPGHEPRRYLLQARQELWPWRGEGIREAAEEHNRARS
jgi:GT2 family glycosyltransferase/glycosyltransferase involved in cell wall biosynthesis